MENTSESRFSSILQKERRIPVKEKFDIVVVGGGPAGVAAAVSAARNGAKTLLVEATGCFGGMGTNGLVPCFCPYSSKEYPLIRGIGYEILERLRKKDGVGNSGNSFKWVTIDAEKLKIVYDEMVKESKVDFLFFTVFSDVIVKKNNIKAIIIENKNGRQAIEAKIFIDCSGDADVAFKAAVPCNKGDEKRNLQAPSLCFVIAGIDTEKYLKYYSKIGGQKGLRKVLQNAETKGLIKGVKGTECALMSDHLRKSGILGLNYGHIFGIDGTDTKQVSEGMMKGRQLADEFMKFARKNIPGMEKSEVANTGTLLGVRETRRIIGEFCLEENAFHEGKRFDDDIAVYDYPIDVHDSKKHKKGNGNSFSRFCKISQKIAYGIPFKAMLPKKINNLLVAGRSISADRSMQGTTRVMPACFAMGQAAGTASAIAIRKNIPLRKIPIKELQNKLIKQEAYLGNKG